MTRRAALLCVLLTAGCTGTETGNPPVIDVSFAVHSGDPEVSVAGDVPASVVVQQLWLSVGEITFQPEDACEDPAAAEVAMAGPAAIELLSDPPSVAFRPESGRYCRADVPLVPAAVPLPPGAPQRLEGHTLVLTGLRADGVPFIVATRSAPALALGPGDGAAFEVSAGDRLLIGIDAAAWLLPLDLEAALPDHEGTVVVDDASDDHRHAALVAHLPGGVTLYRDADDSGTVDPGDERIGSHHDP